MEEVRIHVRLTNANSVFVKDLFYRALHIAQILILNSRDGRNAHDTYRLM